MSRRHKPPARRSSKRRPPVASALVVSTMAVMTVTERVPDLQSQPAGAVAQAPVRRNGEMDEAHKEAATEAFGATQSVEQAPPVAGMPPERQIMADNASRDEAAWWPAIQAAMDTTNRRNAFLLDGPKPAEGEPPTDKPA